MVNARTYRVGPSTIVVRFGDITESPADVIVSSDDFELSMGGGVSQAILTAGGGTIAEDADKMIPARSGDVIVTTAGGLPAKYLFHAVMIGPDWGSDSRGAVIRQACQKAMRLLPLLGCRSIAFPAIGTGVAGISFEIAASEMAATLVGALLDAPEPCAVELYLYDAHSDAAQDAFFAFFEQFAARTMALEATRGSRGRGWRLRGPSSRGPSTPRKRGMPSDEARSS